VYPGHRLVRKPTALRYARHLRRLAAVPTEGRVGRVRDSLVAWFGHARWGSAYRLNRLVLGRAGLLAG
jgi:hypothetical protein